MRYVKRQPLPLPSQRYLTKKQAEVNKGKDALTTWNHARKTKATKGVDQTLCSMVGPRERCMYCEDSRGTDIDHFWPLSQYPDETFLWPNLLLICAGCNRAKGNRFDIDSNGQPLLIDPTEDQPWTLLVFDERTGNLSPRFDPQTGSPMPKGRHTCDPDVLPLNIEAITEGRSRAYRNLRRAVRNYLVAAARDEIDDKVDELVSSGAIVKSCVLG